MNEKTAVPVEAWNTTKIALKWCCRTTHDKWRRVGHGVLDRGLEAAADLTAGREVIAIHANRDHRSAMERCLGEDSIRFWDLVYKYWRARGPHDGASRETIDLDKYKAELE